jgi:outer membrane lipase/esterase
MASHWMRRALLALASASALSLVACGSGTIESQLRPARIVSFGDAFSDLGQGGSRYTVNDGTVNIWAQHVAGSFGVPLNNAVAGGTSYAVGNARVVATPSAAGSSATPTLKEQIDLFQGTGGFAATDLVVINGGTADVVAEAATVMSGAQTPEQMVASVRQAGTDLGAQVRRLVQAGAKHVVVVGPYDLGKSPWAVSTGQASLLSNASGAFNEQLLLSIVDLGANVLYVDAALAFNLMIAHPAAYDLTNVTAPACNSVDPGPGIGTGAGQVNSALCTPATLGPGVNYPKYLFADRVYPTPRGHLRFGEYAFEKIRARW